MALTMPQEHPIPFSGDMVRAILDGRKTQTRRVIKPQPVNQMAYDELSCRWYETNYRGEPVILNSDGGLACPYGRAGGRLWVRETWRAVIDPDYWDCIEYKADMRRNKPSGLTEDQGHWFNDLCETEDPRWRPSIHMPRWASRITLEVTRIRVERVQAITWQDIRAEGVNCPLHDGDGCFCCSECDALREAWILLWDSINAKRGYGWDVNPYVWVVDFKLLEGEQHNV